MSEYQKRQANSKIPKVYRKADLPDSTVTIYIYCNHDDEICLLSKCYKFEGTRLANMLYGQNVIILLECKHKLIHANGFVMIQFSKTQRCIHYYGALWVFFD